MLNYFIEEGLNGVYTAPRSKHHTDISSKKIFAAMENNLIKTCIATDTYEHQEKCFYFKKHSTMDQCKNLNKYMGNWCMCREISLKKGLYFS